MSRIRTIKPEMAKHEDLFDLEQSTGLPMRFAWAMLPTACDREGRFQWRPRTLKADILPHDLIEFSRVLDAWLTRGFIVKYRVGNEWYGWVPTFKKHQVINTRETASSLPDFTQSEETVDHRNHKVDDACPTRAPRDYDACLTREVHARGEGKGKEGKGKEGDSSSELSGPADAGPGKCPQKEIIAAYHATLPELPPVNVWTDQNAEALRVRWRSDPERQTLEWWEGFFAYVRKCPFLMGQKTDFQASLGWLVKASNFAKVLNGQYEQRSNA